MLNASQNANTAAAPVLAASAAKNSQAKNGQFPNPLTAAAGSAEAASGTPKATDPKNVAAEAQDRFLKLLVTQMKNQDPLNPMDNAQVTSQMAQLSTVSGIDKVNATLNALNGSMLAAHSMQAAAMIGHVVVVPGNKMELKNGKGVAALDLTQPADNVTVQITDAAGGVVRTLNLDSQKSGIAQIQWDGKNDSNVEVKDGNYNFSATAKLGEAKSSVNGLSYGLVNGVMQKPEGAALKVEQLGEVNMDAVKQIL